MTCVFLAGHTDWEVGHIYFQNAAALKEISAVRGGHAIPPP